MSSSLISPPTKHILSKPSLLSLWRGHCAPKSFPQPQPHLLRPWSHPWSYQSSAGQQFREQNKFSASRACLCSQERREEVEGRRLQPQQSPGRSCPRAKNTHGPVSQAARGVWQQHILLLWPGAVLCPAPAPPAPLTPTKNDPQRFKRLLQFIRCHCTGSR